MNSLLPPRPSPPRRRPGIGRRRAAGAVGLLLAAIVALAPAIPADDAPAESAALLLDALRPFHEVSVGALDVAGTRTYFLSNPTSSTPGTDYAQAESSFQIIADGPRFWYTTEGMIEHGAEPAKPREMLRVFDGEVLVSHVRDVDARTPEGTPVTPMSYRVDAPRRAAAGGLLASDPRVRFWFPQLGDGDPATIAAHYLPASEPGPDGAVIFRRAFENGGADDVHVDPATRRVVRRAVGRAGAPQPALSWTYVYGSDADRLPSMISREEGSPQGTKYVQHVYTFERFVLHEGPLPGHLAATTRHFALDPPYADVDQVAMTRYAGDGRAGETPTLAVLRRDAAP